MDIEAQKQERRDNILSSLNAAIEVLNLVGGISDIVPAKALFGTVSVVLTMIKVSSPLICVNRLQVEVCVGFHDQPDGLRRTWTGLRRCLHRPRQRTEGEEVERSQQFCIGSNWPADDVSYAGSAHFEHLTDEVSA